MRIKAIFFSILCSIFVSYGQNVTVVLIDSASNKSVSGAILYLKNNNTYYFEEETGLFKVPLKDYDAPEIEIRLLGHPPVTYRISAGDIQNNRLRLHFPLDAIPLQQVVVSASRKPQSMVYSPSAIYKIGEREIISVPSNDFYQALSYKPEVEVLGNSFSFKVFNSRGFQTSVPVRVVQMIDGIDNISPLLSFAVGNVYGVSDLDVANIELLTGPASAMYGPNALQGLIYIHTKDPYDYPGFDVRLAAGNRKYTGFDVRYATPFGKNRRFAVKLTASGFRAKEWIANDPEVNVYRKMNMPPVDMDGLLQSRLSDSTATASELYFYSRFKNYLDTVSTDLSLGRRSFLFPGYREKDLIDPGIDNVKAGIDLYYRHATGKSRIFHRIGTGTHIFQGNNRAYLNNFVVNQTGLSAEYESFTFNTYFVKENANDSYTIPPTGINIGMAGLGNYAARWLDEFIHQVESASENYSRPLTPDEIAQIETEVAEIANDAWYKPGTPEFEAVKDAITSNPVTPQGSKTKANSWLYHADFIYTIPIEKFDLLAGAMFRYTKPISEGTVFLDTLMPDGTFRNIAFYETGGFISGGKSLFDDRLNIQAVIRLDKSQYFKPQVSPRLSVTSKVHPNHSLYITYQHAFRNPSINDQYLNINAGPFRAIGNLEGFENLYTESSVSAFFASGDESVLETTTVDPVRPEHLKAIELGYRMHENRLSASANAYFNIYDDFLGSIRAVQPKGGAVAGDESGVQALLNRNYQVFRIFANSHSTIYTAGFALQGEISATSWLAFYSNYTFSKFIEAKNEDDLIPGFNTPEHRVNAGARIVGLWNHFDLFTNFKWVDAYRWESAFADGPIPAYHVWDLSVSAYPRNQTSILKIGVSNLLNNKHIEIYGGGEIGRFWFVSLQTKLPAIPGKRNKTNN